jgi:hypothetical protein
MSASVINILQHKACSQVQTQISQENLTPIRSKKKRATGRTSGKKSKLQESQKLPAANVDFTFQKIARARLLCAAISALMKRDRGLLEQLSKSTVDSDEIVGQIFDIRERCWQLILELRGCLSDGAMSQMLMEHNLKKYFSETAAARFITKMAPDNYMLWMDAYVVPEQSEIDDEMHY